MMGYCQPRQSLSEHNAARRDTVEARCKAAADIAKYRWVGFSVVRVK